MNDLKKLIKEISKKAKIWDKKYSNLGGTNPYAVSGFIDEETYAPKTEEQLVAEYGTEYFYTVKETQLMKMNSKEYFLDLTYQQLQNATFIAEYRGDEKAQEELLKFKNFLEEVKANNYSYIKTLNIFRVRFKDLRDKLIGKEFNDLFIGYNEGKEISKLLTK